MGTVAGFSGDFADHRIEFYEKITRNGKEFIEFTVPFYLTRLSWQCRIRGGSTFLEPKNLDVGPSAYENGLTKITKVHEIKEVSELDLYLGEKPQGGEKLHLHGFCKIPRA